MNEPLGEVECGCNVDNSDKQLSQISISIMTKKISNIPESSLSGPGWKVSFLLLLYCKEMFLIHSPSPMEFPSIHKTSFVCFKKCMYVKLISATQVTAHLSTHYKKCHLIRLLLHLLKQRGMLGIQSVIWKGKLIH